MKKSHPSAKPWPCLFTRHQTPGRDQLGGKTGAQPIRDQVPELWPEKGDNPRLLPATRTKCWVLWPTSYWSTMLGTSNALSPRGVCQWQQSRRIHKQMSLAWQPAQNWPYWPSTMLTHAKAWFVLCLIWVCVWWWGRGGIKICITILYYHSFHALTSGWNSMKK